MLKAICFACLAVVLFMAVVAIAMPDGPGGNEQTEAGGTSQPASEAETPEDGAGPAAKLGQPVQRRALTSALAWIASKQLSDGRWSFGPPSDAGKSLGSPGTWKSDSAATALALLPMLGAGETHERKGPYQKNIADGLNWLVKRQTADGDLSAGGERKLLSHA